jgi:arylsulfatase A-like enzyme
VSLLLWALGCAGTEPPADAPPDVVVVLVDTLRADQLGVYGADPSPSPYLDGLASQGAVFDTAWSTSSWTAPSTASVFTGAYPLQHGVVMGFKASSARRITLNAIPDSRVVLPEVFQDAGYTTLGLASNPNVCQDMGFDQGFDRFHSETNAPADELFRRLRRWWRAAEQPRFVYLHINDVHYPYGTGGEPQDLYRGEIAHLDAQLAELHDDLGWDDAKLLVISDHGEEFGDHGGTKHDFSLYRELNRVVFVAHGPGVQAGRPAANVSLVDVLPTLCGWTGVPCPAGGQGQDLSPALAGGAVNDAAVFAHRLDYNGAQALWSVVAGDRRLIQGPQGAELYAVAADPTEEDDLSAAEPQTVGSLTEVLTAFQQLEGAGDEGQRTLEHDDATDAMLRELGYVGD